MADAIELHVDADDFAGEDDTATAAIKALATKRKGRGFGGAGVTGQFDSLSSEGKGPGPQKSIEGWIVFVRGVHEEATEQDLRDTFAEYGQIQNLHLNLDRLTGFVKGYGLVEYEKLGEAEKAVKLGNGVELLGRPVEVTWAFSRPPEASKPTSGSGRRQGRGGDRA